MGTLSTTSSAGSAQQKGSKVAGRAPAGTETDPAVSETSAAGGAAHSAPAGAVAGPADASQLKVRKACLGVFVCG